MNKKLITSIASGAAFMLLIALLFNVDVSPEVGLSAVNKAFHDITGVSMFWYDVSSWLGFIPMITASCFALKGIVQLIRRRSLIKADHDILLLGALWFFIICIYVFFEKFTVSMRPISPEPSFPSTHVFVAMTVMISAMMVRKGRLMNCICISTVIIMTVSRTLSGVHWVTDIIGGILLSVTLLSLFSFALEKLR